MQPVWSQGRGVLRKYLTACSMWLSCTQRKKWKSNAAHMQQISSDLRTPVEKLHMPKAHNSQDGLALSECLAQRMIRWLHFKGTLRTAINHKAGYSPINHSITCSLSPDFGIKVIKNSPEWKIPSNEPRPNQTNTGTKWRPQSRRRRRDAKN